jgi:hypothetical protein
MTDHEVATQLSLALTTIDLNQRLTLLTDIAAHAAVWQCSSVHVEIAVIMRARALYQEGIDHCDIVFKAEALAPLLTKSRARILVSDLYDLIDVPIEESPLLVAVDECERNGLCADAANGYTLLGILASKRNDWNAAVTHHTSSLELLEKIRLHDRGDIRITQTILTIASLEAKLGHNEQVQNLASRGLTELGDSAWGSATRLRSKLVELQKIASSTL